MRAERAQPSMSMRKIMPITLSEEAASSSPSPSWSASVTMDHAMVRRDSGSPTPDSFDFSPLDHATERRTHAFTAPRSATRSLPVMPDAPTYASMTSMRAMSSMVARRKCTISPLMGGMTMRSGSSLARWSVVCSFAVVSAYSDMIIVSYVSRRGPSPHPYRRYCTRLNASWEFC